jgi:phosphoribosylformylglycinamidine cyclo-ligase
MPNAYAALGVSATKEDVHRALAGADEGLFPSAFCRIGPDVLAGDPAYCSALHADGAGTKALVAYLHWRETGDATVFHGIAQDSLAMNLDDLACVGAGPRFMLTNAIGRNARLVSGEVVAEIVRGYADCCVALREQGVEVVPTGGETADLGDAVRTILVDSAVAARWPRAKLIDAGRIVPGDAIVGFASAGPHDSGIGSNGLTLARHALLRKDYLDRYPETVAPETPRAAAYRGRFALADRPDGLGMTVSEALLSPTRLLAPLILRLAEALGPDLHAAIHCTGGGLGKCLRFGRGVRFVKDNLFPLPPVFRLVAEAAGLGAEEIARTFNCGHRLEIYLPPGRVAEAFAVAAGFGIAAQRIGQCEASAGPNEVVVRAGFGAATLR